MKDLIHLVKIIFCLYIFYFVIQYLCQSIEGFTDTTCTEEESKEYIMNILNHGFNGFKKPIKAEPEIREDCFKGNIKMNTSQSVSSSLNNEVSISKQNPSSGLNQEVSISGQTASSGLNQKKNVYVKKVDPYFECRGDANSWKRYYSEKILGMFFSRMAFFSGGSYLKIPGFDYKICL